MFIVIKALRLIATLYITTTNLGLVNKIGWKNWSYNLTSESEETSSPIAIKQKVKQKIITSVYVRER